jgi:cell wall-associated NlpC family hydrolase
VDGVDGEDLRGKIVANALWGVVHEPEIHYDRSAARLAALAQPQRLPLATDCSGFVTLCYAWAGAPNPNGGAYGAHLAAWTGTLLEHCRRIPRKAVRRADLVVWGAPPGHHVSLVVEPGDDPLLVSHGQERGPVKVRFSAENAWQAAHGHAEVAWVTAL